MVPHRDKAGSDGSIQETVPVSQSIVDAIQSSQQKERRISLVVYHRNGAEIVPLRAGEPLVIGREPPAHVRIHDPGLSREHARFVLGDSGVVVEDLGSTNGTWIGGERATKVLVRPGDEVVMGGVRAFVHLPSPSEGATLGFEGHERFRLALEDEVLRARFFVRPLGLLMVRAARLPNLASHVGRWGARVRSLLRPVDRAAIYSPEAIEILLPESGGDAVMDLARAIVSGRGEGEPPLLVGSALFPEAATDAESLLGLAWGAVQRATPESPLQAARTGTWSASEGSPKAVDVEEPVVESPATQKLFETARRVAAKSITVLLQGETGVGKEVIARAIHAASPRKSKPMISVNCGAIPGQLVESTLFGHVRGAFTGAFQDHKGVFEAADGGTVLLDEIGELPSAAQAALLRVLDTKRVVRVGSTKEIPVDARVIAATHRDLEAMCESGSFRSDLLFRLNAMSITIPPLRARADEIEPLAKRFLREAAKANGVRIKDFEPGALALLRSYSWPGNIRELRNAVERAVVIASSARITEDDLPDRVRAAAMKEPEAGRAAPAGSERPAPPPESGGGPRAADPASAPGAPIESLKESVRRFEIQCIIRALDACGGNQTEASRKLDLPLRTLAHKIKTYGIKRRGYDIG